MPLTISELAGSAGVGVETVRFYQRKGLLFDPRPGTSARRSGQRHYGDEDVSRLRFIRSAQTAGFTLEEIRELLQLDRSEDRARVRAMAKARIAAFDMVEFMPERDIDEQGALVAAQLLAGGIGLIAEQGGQG